LSTRHDDLYLVDIIEAADKLAAMLESASIESFLSDPILNSAAQHQLTIMGEASGRLQDPSIALMPDVPFHQVRGLRNRLVHGYFNVDLELVWAIATEGAPVLGAAAERALQSLFPDTYERLQARRKGEF
jgi:uncharacterized protein with HEPN domain